MTTPRRTGDLREAYLCEVSDRYLKGEPMHVIAEAMDRKPMQILRDVNVLRERWLKKMVANYDAHISEEVAKLNAIEHEYWQAWVRSQRPRRRTVRNKVTGDKTETTEETPGDPRFLDGLRQTCKQRVELLGMEAPKRIIAMSEEGPQSADKDIVRIYLPETKPVEESGNA